MVPKREPARPVVATECGHEMVFVSRAVYPTVRQDRLPGRGQSMIKQYVYFDRRASA